MGTVADGTLKGSFLTLGQGRPFRQERTESSEAASLRAAALRSLASSWFRKCWIDPDTQAKGLGSGPPRYASRSARTSRLLT